MIFKSVTMAFINLHTYLTRWGGYRACIAAQAENMSCCTVHLHSSGWGLNLGLKMLNK